MKYGAWVLVGLLMAGLAGCGGGGGDGGKNDMIATLEADLARVQADLATAQGELATTKGTLTTTQSELATTKGTLTTTQSELATTKGTLTTTQSELATTKGTLTTTQSELATTKGTLTTTQSELATTKGTLTTTQSELATAKTQLATAQTDLTAKQQALDGLLDKASVSTVTALNAKLDTYASLQTRVDGILSKAGVDTLTALSTKLQTDSELQSAVTALLTATGTTSLTALQTAYNTAKTDYSTLNTQVQATLTSTGAASLTALQTSVASLRTQVTTLQTQLAQAQQQAQTLEANNRAEKLRQAFQGATPGDGGGDPTLVSPLVDSPVEITVPTRNKLTFKQGDRTVRTISTGGFRGARLTRTRGGTDTTVVYTDIELSRQLVKHYANTESTANPGQFSLPEGVFNPGMTNFIDKSKSTEPIPSRVSLTHGFNSSVTATAERTKTSRKASFSGSVHGVSGTFRCEGTGCMLTATGTYNAADVDSNPNRLSRVTLNVSGGGTIYFKPSSATASVSLCAETTQCLTDDGQYMVFGWWREEPASAVADYRFGVFAEIPEDAGASSNSLTGTAEYDGTAVGMYVEQGALGTSGVVTKQGEFTADVRLDVTFDGADSSGIDGTIDGFKTTPTGGSSAPTTSSTWAVKLTKSGTVLATDTNQAAKIDIQGTTSTGAWSYTFVGNHATAAPIVGAQLHPSAMTGTFNTRIPNLLHLVGAFGAERQ